MITIWPKRNCYRREPHSVCWTRLSFTLVRLVIHHCTAEEEVYFARRALRGDVASRRRMIESNLRLVGKKLPAVMAIVVWRCWT